MRYLNGLRESPDKIATNYKEKTVTLPLPEAQGKHYSHKTQQHWVPPDVTL